MAWLLQRQGHQVTLVDPQPGGPQGEGAGSTAALGLLMAQVYRRSSGRGWRLRQQSLQLWQAWRAELIARGHALPWRPGLLQLAQSEQELDAQARLAAERQARGLPLRLLSREELQGLQPAMPEAALGGLLSERDGQLDPLPAMAALRADGLRLGLQERADAAARLERTPTEALPWRLHLAGGEALELHWLVLCAGLASPGLLAPLGHHRPQTPVLGQALELQLSTSSTDAGHWPGSISWGGVNLVPRPGRRLWLGATLEPGAGPADGQALEQLRTLAGQAPAWLREAAVIRHWQGLRARPEGRPAPLLELLEPGLLLAPASAAWAAEQITAPP